MANNNPVEWNKRPWVQGLACLGVCVAFQGVAWGQELPSPEVQSLSLTEYIQRVLDRNQALQIQELQTQIQRSREKAESGIFEPELFLSYDHIDSERPNTVEQQTNLSGTRVFTQENDLYGGGLEALVPTGARVQLSYSLNDLSNNLQRNGTLFGNPVNGNEYFSFAGVSLTQPLLKNAGTKASMAAIRLAARESKIAYQRYRSQLMQTIATAEALYWDLYFAQEQEQYFSESVSVTQTLLDDVRVRLGAGKASNLDVLEVESNHALRQTQHDEAKQNVVDNGNRLVGLYSEAVSPSSPLNLVAADAPVMGSAVSLDYWELSQEAFQLNPDYLRQREEVLKQNIRLAYSKNQRLPQLDLKASYGLNGLGLSPSDAFNDLEQGRYPSWSVGLEFRIPIGGNKKAKHELEAVRLEKKQALMGLKDIETQMLNALNSAIHRLKTSEANVRNYEKVVQFYRNLLDTQMARFEAGTIDNRQVLQTEEEWLKARNDALQSVVGYQRARIEIELISGTLLEARTVDMSQEDLAERTEFLIHQPGELTEERYEFYRGLMKDPVNYQATP